MTFGRYAILLTVVLVAVPIVATLASGVPTLTGWLWVAWVPAVLANRSDHADWTARDVADRLRGEHPIEAELDAALRPPIPTPGFSDADDAFFVPDCPR